MYAAHPRLCNASNASAAWQSEPASHNLDSTTTYTALHKLHCPPTARNYVASQLRRWSRHALQHSSNSVAAHVPSATPHAPQTFKLSYPTCTVPAQRTTTTHSQLYQRQHTFICCASASLVDQLHTHQRCTSGRHVHLPASQPAAVLFIRHKLRCISTLEHTTNSIVITAEADAAGR